MALRNNYSEVSKLRKNARPSLVLEAIKIDAETWAAAGREWNRKWAGKESEYYGTREARELRDENFSHWHDLSDIIKHLERIL